MRRTIPHSVEGIRIAGPTVACTVPFRSTNAAELGFGPPRQSQMVLEPIESVPFAFAEELPSDLDVQNTRTGEDGSSTANLFAPRIINEISHAPFEKLKRGGEDGDGGGTSLVHD